VDARGLVSLHVLRETQNRRVDYARDLCE
jgi:hypothetical protein